MSWLSRPSKAKSKMVKMLFKRQYGYNAKTNAAKLKVHRVTLHQTLRSGHATRRGSGVSSVFNSNNKTQLSCEMHQFALTYSFSKESWIWRSKVGRRKGGHAETQLQWCSRALGCGDATAVDRLVREQQTDSGWLLLCLTELPQMAEKVPSSADGGWWVELKDDAHL